MQDSVIAVQLDLFQLGRSLVISVETLAGLPDVVFPRQNV